MPGKHSGFKMQGYSYPGTSPIKEVGDYTVTDEDISAAKAGGASSDTIKKLQDSKNKSDQKKKNLQKGKELLASTTDLEKIKKLEEGIKAVKES